MERLDRPTLKADSRPPAIVDDRSISTEPWSIRAGSDKTAVIATSEVRCPGTQALPGFRISPMLVEASLWPDPEAAHIRSPDGKRSIQCG